jgi:hypothetical protein
MIAEVLSPEDITTEQVEMEASALEIQVSSLEILTAEDCELACELEKRVGLAIKRAVTLTEKSIQTAKDSLEAAKKVREDLCGPLERSKPVLRQKIGAWREAEKERSAAIARAARESAQRMAEEEALSRAVRLESSGNTAAAEALIAHVPAPPVVMAAPRPSGHGVNVRKVWSAQVDDLAKLIAWVAEDISGRKAFLEPCMPALNAQARSLKDDLRIPGISPSSRFA